MKDKSYGFCSNCFTNSVIGIREDETKEELVCTCCGHTYLKVKDL
jgi:hypothetical protein